MENDTETDLAGSDEEYRSVSSVITIDEPESVITESIRALRTQLVTREWHGNNSIAVCGPSADVGTTFVTVNTAVALAQTGVRTLLVDADLHDPAIDKILLPAKQGPGLADFLVGDLELDEVVMSHVITDLSVLYAGNVTSAPPELLARERFKELIEHCARGYDFVLIDTPPANRFADSRYIGATAGSALVVARKDMTSVGDLKSLIRELEQSGAVVMGVVLNEY